MDSTAHAILLPRAYITDIPRAIATGSLGLVAIIFSYVIYQLFFHPLAGYPGPFLAKFSTLWLFYVEAILSRPTEKMMELHKTLGPVIRISPNELSINDMDIYDKIYSQTSHFTKAEFFYNTFANKSGNLFTYTSPAEHSHHKKLMSHVFARSQILKLEPGVYEKCTRVLDRMARASKKSEAISLFMAFRCLTLEVISDFGFGKPLPAIDGEGGSFKGVELFDAFDTAAALTPMLGHLTVVRALMRILTDWLPNDPFRNMGDGAEAGLKAVNEKEDHDIDRPMIFESMLAKAKKSDVKLDNETLISQGIMVLIAGTDTTAVSLSYGLHCMLSSPGVYNRLRKELLPIMPKIDSRPTIIELESCEYLSACVKELFRKSCAVRGRLPRTVPEGGFELYGKTIPQGAIVGGSAMYSHFDEKIFPSPSEFKPERWLVGKDQAQAMERHLAHFSKGKRACIGSNLARMEIFITVSQFVRRFDLVKLVDENIDIKDHFTVYLSQGINVMLEEIDE